MDEKLRMLENLSNELINAILTNALEKPEISFPGRG